MRGDKVMAISTPDLHYAVVNASEFARLADEPNALALLVLLRLNHGARLEPFAIVPDSMRDARVIGDWSRKLYMRARDALLERGFMDRVHQGGGRGNPHLYTLRKRCGKQPITAPRLSA